MNKDYNAELTTNTDQIELEFAETQDIPEEENRAVTNDVASDFEDNVASAEDVYDDASEAIYEETEEDFEEEIDTEEDDNVSRLLYEYDYEYNKEEANLYVKTTNGTLISRGTIIFCAVVLVIGIALTVLRGAWITAVVCVILDGMMLGFPFLMLLVKQWKFYSRNKNAWSCTKHITMYDDHVEIFMPSATFNFTYDDFYKIKHNDTRIYMIAGAKGVVILRKDDTPHELQTAVLTLNDPVE